MGSCSKQFSLHVEPTVCGAGTDWSNPGSCRLRIKNFNPNDWIGLTCPVCNPSIATVWDGTFSVWVAGQTYSVAPGWSLDGKELTTATSVLFLAGAWRITLVCGVGVGGYIFNGATAGPTPIGLYVGDGITDCVLIPKSAEVEAYSL